MGVSGLGERGGGGGLIFTTALGNIGLQSLGEKMVLITNLFYSLLLSFLLLLFYQSSFCIVPHPHQEAGCQFSCGLF